MISGNILAGISYKLFALIFTLYCAVAGAPSVPSTDEMIDYTNSGAKLVFAAIADPQLSNYLYERNTYFVAAAQDLRNAKGLDAMLIPGDIAENGNADEYQRFIDELGGMNLRYLACVGNHDIRLRAYGQSSARFNTFLNTLNGDDSAKSLHYSEFVNGVKFIIMGSDRTEFEESYISDEQLSWLDSELASQNGELTFVVIHQPLKLTHGLPDVWNSPFDSAGSVGAQSDRIREILGRYDNVIFITGHEHTGFGQYTYERIDGFDSVNLPSLCCNNADGDYNEHGIGCIVEVYDGRVVFRARDFMKGIWLPDYDVEIKVS